MTLVYLPRHVDQLISEIRSEWAPSNDPDMDRVANAFPLHVLEKAYLKKLDAETNRKTFTRATSVDLKVAVLRKILAAWLRAPHQRLGQLMVNALNVPIDSFEPIFYNKEDGALADAVEALVSYTRNK